MDIIPLLIIAGIWILNFIISAFNAIGAGRIFKDKEYANGWMKMVIWSVVIMSVCGFTWCYLILVAIIAGALNYLEPVYVQGALELGYLLLIFPILGAGLVMWIQSIITAYKQRTFGTVAVAGWNTFAMLSNSYSAFKSIPGVLKNVDSLFKGDSRSKGFLLMIVAVIIAACAGIITTYCLIKWSEKQR